MAVEEYRIERINPFNINLGLYLPEETHSIRATNGGMQQIADTATKLESPRLSNIWSTYNVAVLLLGIVSIATMVYEVLTSTFEIQIHLVGHTILDPRL